MEVNQLRQEYQDSSSKKSFNNYNLNDYAIFLEQKIIEMNAKFELINNIESNKAPRKSNINSLSIKANMDLIFEAYCDVSGYQFSQLIKNFKSRKGEVVKARQMAWTYIHENTKMSFREIGTLFICAFDHATVMHSIGKFKNLYETEREYRYVFNNMKLILDKKFKKDFFK